MSFTLVLLCVKLDIFIRWAVLSLHAARTIFVVLAPTAVVVLEVA